MKRNSLIQSKNSKSREKEDKKEKDPIIKITGERKQKENYMTIENFNFQNRSVLLLTIHLFHDTLENLRNIRQQKGSFISQYLMNRQLNNLSYIAEKYNKKLDIVQTLLDSCIIIAHTQEKNEGISPFCDSLNINDEKFKKLREIDPSPFFEDFGSHVIPYFVSKCFTDCTGIKTLLSHVSYEYSISL